MKDSSFPRAIIAIAIFSVVVISCLPHMVIANGSEINPAGEKKALIPLQDRLRPGDIIAWSDDRAFLDIPESARHGMT